MAIKYRYFIALLPLGLIFLLVACVSETQSLPGIDVSEEEKLTEEIATTVQTSEKIVELDSTTTDVEKSSSENVDIWTIKPGIVRADTTSTSSVILPDGRIRTYMLVEGVIVFADSRDGLDLSDITKTNIAGTGKPADTQSFVSNPSVLLRGDGKFLMVYEASDYPPPDQKDRILYAAISDDGINFRVIGPLPSSKLDISPGRGTLFQSVPDMVKLPNGTIRLYYVANGSSIASMHSDDMGLTWYQDKGYRLKGGHNQAAYVDPDIVVHEGGGFTMYIAYGDFKGNCGGLGCQRLVAAYSNDGINFDLDIRPVLDVGDEDTAYLDPDVYQDAKGNWYMLYGEKKSSGQNINLRVAIRGDDTATPSAVPTSKSKPTPVIKPTLTPIPEKQISKPTIVGKVKFQVDVPDVASAENLGQASIVGPSLIQLEDGRYRLYIQARADSKSKGVDGVNIISLISNDAIKWDAEPGIRIMHGSEANVDYEAGEPGVFQAINGKYYMAYTGRFMGLNKNGAEQKMHRIVFAVSDDGLSWTKLDKHYEDPENINDFASSADVHIIDGEYVIYYTGQRNIIRATSADGLKWERKEIAISAGHDSTMVKLDETYYLFAKMPEDLIYGGNPDTANDFLVMAMSQDGINWSNEYYQVVVHDSNGRELIFRDIQDPGSIILSDGSLRLFLNDDGGKNIYSIKPTSDLPKIGMRESLGANPTPKPDSNTRRKPEVLKLIKNVEVTPDEKLDIIGAFCRINYVPAADKFLVTFGGTSKEKGTQGYGYKWYTTEMEFTGEVGLFEDRGTDTASVMIDSTYYFLTDGGKDKWALKKYDPITWTLLGETLMSRDPNKEPKNDFMLAYVNGMLDAAGLYVADAESYVDQKQTDPYKGEATSHQFFTNDLEFLEKRVLLDTPHLNATSMVYVDGVYNLITSTAFFGDLIVMQYDQDWNYIGSKVLAQWGNWPMGTVYDPELRLFFVSYIYMENIVNKNGFRNIRLAVFDAEWNSITDIAVTQYGKDSFTQSGRPSVILHGGRAYVSYDISTVSPKREENEDWECAVSEYEIAR